MSDAKTELILQILKDFEESYQEYLESYVYDDTPEIRAQYTYAAVLIAEATPSNDATLQDAYIAYLRAEHVNALAEAVRKNSPTK